MLKIFEAILSITIRGSLQCVCAENTTEKKIIFETLQIITGTCKELFPLIARISIHLKVLCRVTLYEYSIMQGHMSGLHIFMIDISEHISTQ